ncbi:MAG: acyl-CoA thioesterase [Oscillospiraceae bacterium]|nr:acyl-CoA thioesterase [Oscillospiraceae bacterium]
MNTIKPYARKVFYYETDKMKVAHHSNYIRMFEEARVDFLEQAGLSFKAIEDFNVMVPVLSVECRYISPLVFDEEFAVYLKIEKFNGVRLDISYRIVSRNSGKLCAEGRTSHCFTDMNMKPLRTKAKYPEIYNIFHEYTGYEVQD